MNERKFFTLVILILLAGLRNSWASDSSASKQAVISPITQTNSQLATEVTVPQENFSGSVGISYSGNLMSEEDYGASRGFGLEFIPVFKFGEFTSLSTKINIDQESQGQDEEYPVAVSNIPLSLSYKRFKLLKAIDVTNKLTLVLPANEKVVKRDKYCGAIAIGADLDYQVQALPLMVKLGTSLSRNFHEFEVNADSEALNVYVLAMSLTGIYSIDKFKITLTATHKQVQTYEGFEKGQFVAGAELEYGYDKAWAFQLGTKNEGSALKANGQDSNFDLFNENSSALYGGLSYSF